MSTGARSLLDSGSPEDAGDLLRSALSLWRGRALEDVANEPWAMVEAHRLDEERVVALESRLQADLAAGRHSELVPELQELVTLHPLRENLHQHLMLALYRAGRQADALAVYRRCASTLAEELGLEPGPELRSLEDRILIQDPDLEWHPLSNSSPARVEVPDQAPMPQSSAASIIGRTREIATLRRAWEDACQGRGSVVLVAGEPGIGKSTLVEEMSEWISDDATACWGRCPEADGAPPFWPWVEVLRDAAESVPLQQALGEADLRSVATLVPELAPLETVSAGGDTPETRFRVYDAVARYLTETVASRPTLLLLEDLHRADGPSLDLLCHLGGLTRRVPLMVVATYQDHAISPGDPLALAIAALSRQTTTVRLQLGRLDREATKNLATFLDPDISEDTLDLVAERTEGNPFFVAELVTWLSEERSKTGSDGIPRGIPAVLKDVIRDRLTNFDDETRRLLDAAAVLGRTFDPELLARIVDADNQTVLRQLEPVFDAGLIEELHDHSWNLRFSHGLIRDTIYEDLAPADRASWHGSAGDAMSTIDSPRVATPVALHYVRALPLGSSVRAIDACLDAADHARRTLALEQAETHLRDALEIVSSISDPPTEVRVRARLASLLEESDGYNSPRVHDAARRVLDLAHEIGQYPEVAGVVWSLWSFWINRAEFQLAAEFADRLVEGGTQESDAAALTAGLLSRGTTYFHIGRLAGAATDLERARAMAVDLHPDEIAARNLGHMVLACNCNTAHTFWLVGRGEEGKSHLTEAIAAAADRDEDRYRQAHTRLFRAWLASVENDAETAAHAASRGLELSADFPQLRVLLQAFDGWATARLDDAERGERQLADSRAELKLARFHMLAPLLADLHADTLDRSGRSDEALALVDRAIEISYQTGEVFHLAELLRHKAVLCFELGAGDPFELARQPWRRPGLRAQQL